MILFQINYALIEPDNKYGEIYTPSGNSSFWITTLDNVGVPSQWKRSVEVQSWESTQKNLEKKNYSIEINFLKQSNVTEASHVNGIFTWNTSDCKSITEE